MSANNRKTKGVFSALSKDEDVVEELDRAEDDEGVSTLQKAA